MLLINICTCFYLCYNFNTFFSLCHTVLSIKKTNGLATRNEQYECFMLPVSPDILSNIFKLLISLSPQYGLHLIPRCQAQHSLECLLVMEVTLIHIQFSFYVSPHERYLYLQLYFKIIYQYYQDI